MSRASDEWMSELCWLLGVLGVWDVLRTNKDVFLCNQRRRLESCSRITPFDTQQSECPLSWRWNAARLGQLHPQPWPPLFYCEKDPQFPPLLVGFTSHACFGSTYTKHRFYIFSNKVGNTGSLVWEGSNFLIIGMVLNVFCSADLEFPV